MRGTIPALLGLLLLAAPAVVQAQCGSGDNFDYTINPDETNTIAITGYTGTNVALVIPANINNLLVTSIGSYAFASNSLLASVTIPGSVTSIGDDAFFYCENLSSVTISNGVSIIGELAFFYCWSLEYVTIPASITSVGDGAFANSGMTDIMVDRSNPFYSSVDGVLFDKGQTTLVGFPSGVYGTYTIPSTVTNISQWAFSYCFLSESSGSNLNSFTFQLTGAGAQNRKSSGSGLPASVHTFYTVCGQGGEPSHLDFLQLTRSAWAAENTRKKPQEILPPPLLCLPRSIIKLFVAFP